jgi:hypothetical protein
VSPANAGGLCDIRYILFADLGKYKRVFCKYSPRTVAVRLIWLADAILTAGSWRKLLATA